MIVTGVLERLCVRAFLTPLACSCVSPLLARSCGAPPSAICVPPPAPHPPRAFRRRAAGLEHGHKATELAPENGPRQPADVSLKPRGRLGDRLGQRSAMVGAPHGDCIIVKAAPLQLLRLDRAPTR